ncbi:MAG: S26 family signal peptidase [Sphingomonas sp.]
MSRRQESPSDAPLLAWGEALRTLKRHRARRLRRMTLGGLALGLVIGSAILPPAPRLVWNATASALIGLYLVAPGATPVPGDMVIARPPERFHRFAAARHYLPLDVPLVKRVAARSGQRVCAAGPHILIDGQVVATRRAVDGRGRRMPAWQGCYRLRDGELFLLNPDPASFDGRYFGVTERGDVIGTARLLWRR